MMSGIRTVMSGTWTVMSESLKSLVDQNKLPSPIDFVEGVTQINNILVSAAKKSFYPLKAGPDPQNVQSGGVRKFGKIRNVLAIKLSCESIVACSPLIPLLRIHGSGPLAHPGHIPDIARCPKYGQCPEPERNMASFQRPYSKPQLLMSVTWIVKKMMSGIRTVMSGI